MMTVLWIALSVVVAAFYAAAETGAYRLNRIRLHGDAKRGRRTAKLTESVVADMERYVCMTLTAHNTAVYCGTVFFTALVAHCFRAAARAGGGTRQHGDAGAGDADPRRGDSQERRPGAGGPADALVESAALADEQGALAGSHAAARAWWRSGGGCSEAGPSRARQSSRRSTSARCFRRARRKA